MWSRGMSFRELSRRTGLAAPTLNQYVNGRRLPRAETIEVIARALECEPASFFEYRRAMVLERLADSPTVIETLYERLLRSPR